MCLYVSAHCPQLRVVLNGVPRSAAQMHQGAGLHKESRVCVPVVGFTYVLCLQELKTSLSSSIPARTQSAFSNPSLARDPSKKATKASGAAGSSTSALPVWVDPNGMATDDSIVQLDTLRDILNGKPIVTASSLRSERSTGSVMSRPSIAGNRAVSSVMESLKSTSH